MPVVEVPGMGDVEFPDDMSNEQIAAAIKQNQPKQSKQPEKSEPSVGSQLLRTGGLMARTGLNVIGSLPLMAADAGVGMRNLITGSNYDNATTMWNEGLDAMGLPKPESTSEKVTDFA